jgi:hypothetical protein
LPGITEVLELFDGKADVRDDPPHEPARDVLAFVQGHRRSSSGIIRMLENVMTAFDADDFETGLLERADYLSCFEGSRVMPQQGLRR